jgi:hypothetical protein
MTITIYLVSASLVFIFSGLLTMAGLGAAFLFVPLFYYLGVPLAEATPTALLLNVVSLLFATINYWRGKLINWRKCNPKNKRANKMLLSNESWKICVYTMLRRQEIKTGLLGSNLWRINNYGY